MTHFDTKRGEISLAELLHALYELPCETQEQTEAIFHALGFNWQNSKPTAIAKHQQKEIYDYNRYRAKPSEQKKPINNSTAFNAPPAPELPIELPEIIVSSTLKPLATDTKEAISQPPDWLDKEGYQLLSETEQTEATRRENLLPDLTHRGTLGAALTLKKTGMDINMHALIEQLIKGRIPRQLPKNIDTTLESGCQLLLDYNDSMVPFWEDLTALAKQIEHFLGTKRVSIYEFDQDPTQAQYWTAAAKPQTWQPQAARPIMVATNLNINGQSKPISTRPCWRTFIDQCEKLHLPLILLIPWQKSYWPDDLGNHPTLIHWNPATTASMIHSLIGQGHEVKQ